MASERPEWIKEASAEIARCWQMSPIAFTTIDGIIHEHYRRSQAGAVEAEKLLKQAGVLGFEGQTPTLLILIEQVIYQRDVARAALDSCQKCNNLMFNKLSKIKAALESR